MYLILLAGYIDHMMNKETAMKLELGKVGEIYLNDPAYDEKLKAIRSLVSLMNAKRKQAGEDKVPYNHYVAVRRYKVELYFRLGRNNPNRTVYAAGGGGGNRFGGGNFRINKEDAERVAIYIRDAIVSK